MKVYVLEYKQNIGLILLFHFGFMYSLYHMSSILYELEIKCLGDTLMIVF